MARSAVYFRFQSTPSVWRETIPPDRFRRRQRISIHSLRVEGDPRDCPPWKDDFIFQSTPSVWRETKCSVDGVKNAGISIHSLRVEGDGCCMRRTSRYNHFNPLPPCGGRRSINRLLAVGLIISIHSLRVEGDRMALAVGDHALFQSTPSVWRETSKRPASGHN